MNVSAKENSIMKTTLEKGIKVHTNFGLGTVIERDSKSLEAYIIKLEEPPVNVKYLQDKYGGITFEIHELFIMET